MNKGILLGRLTKDVELSYVGAENTPKATFTVAINRKFAKNGETDFIQCQAWDKNAENIQKFFSKGSMINVIGAIRVDSWNGDDGKKLYRTYVNVEEWNFCGGKKETEDRAEEENPFMESEDSSDELPF